MDIYIKLPSDATLHGYMYIHTHALEYYIFQISYMPYLEKFLVMQTEICNMCPLVK